MSKLTDDLLVEILSRVPYKSSCRCKCVSTRWRDLISHPDSRKKMPQTLAGFFNETFIPDRSPKWVHCYTDISRRVYPRFDRPLSFLMPDCELMYMYDCCNGLLLLRGYNPPCPRTLDYVVCNPVTEKWVTVPASIWSGKVGVAHLGFDPAVSSHFHVFEFIPASVWDAKSGGKNCGTKALGIYSSKAGAWTHRCAWESPIMLSGFSRSVFLNGVLYLSSYEDFVIAVDLEGNCRFIPIPMPHPSAVHNVYLSQGQLHLVYEGDSAPSIWVLEDISSDKWTLKHQYSQLQLFGKECSSFVWKYEVVSIHPERNEIFIACIPRDSQLPKTLMSYEMDSGERCFICQQVCMVAATYFPFVPLFSELLADAH
jgi:F-box interacting protein